MVTRLYLKRKILYFSLLLCLTVKLNYAQNPNPYFRFLDSSEVYIAGNKEKNLAFLDSIPKPVENYIEGRLGEYYNARALVHGDYLEEAEAFRCFVLSVKYAKIEKEYKIAGNASLQLYRQTCFTKDSTKALNYLDRARHYFNLADYNTGLLEIKLLLANRVSVKNRERSNQMLLDYLNDFKKAIDDDGYLYMAANAYLAENYIFLDSLDKAHKYHQEFLTMKNTPTLSMDNFYDFKGIFNIEMANNFLNKKRVDSTSNYLNKASKYLKNMGEDYVSFYYNLRIDFHKYIKQQNLSKNYIDSLKTFQNKLLENNYDATLELENSISKAELELEAERNKWFYNKTWIFVIIITLISSSLMLFIFYKKNKSKLVESENQAHNFSFVKTNNEKLTLKVQGLEEYISILKKEVKEISMLDESSQKRRIKEFYNNLHLDSSTLLDKSQNHIELVNDLNIDFFKKLQEQYPKLNKSDITICYYLHIGFSNKEIALFLNSTVRAIESKRYRITKKMNLKNATLTDHLKEFF